MTLLRRNSENEKIFLTYQQIKNNFLIKPVWHDSCCICRKLRQ